VGKPCSKRWTKRMKSKLLKLESAHLKARSDMDFDLLADIEMGKFKLK
jgi:hypothetical protein